MKRRFPIAFPHPHFMAFAPLDAWARLLFAPAAWVPVRYWARLAFGLFNSAIGTALTLPERLVLAPVLAIRGRRSGATLHHRPGVVVVLGYFRSGTTHLHYLLSCDPRFRTPRWCETLAPQGWALSWSFLRLFMIPFVSAKRPQDDVAIGPDWPAEDDFAVCNWTLASSLPGRFVLPRVHGHYDRFHSLERLSGRERERWRWTQWAFCWKLAALARGRTLLLKTPSHTARVKALAELFGGNVRFIHISRDPAAVIRSNVSMAARLSMYHLQDPPEGDDLPARIAGEYAMTEQKCADESRRLPPGTFAAVRYEDLVADPMTELRRIYFELRLDWTPDFERRAAAYLQSVRDYRAAGATSSERERGVTPTAAKPAGDAPGAHGPRGLLAGAAVAFLAAMVWIAQSWLLYFPGHPGQSRHDWLVWPVGVLIGLATLRAARVGSVRLGLWAAGLTALAFFAISVPATFLSDYAHRTAPEFPVDYRHLPMRDWEWYHILKSSRAGSLAWNNLFWMFMGAVTAYRFASRPYAHPPGRG